MVYTITRALKYLDVLHSLNRINIQLTTAFAYIYVIKTKPHPSITFGKRKEKQSSILLLDLDFFNAESSPERYWREPRS